MERLAKIKKFFSLEPTVQFEAWRYPNSEQLKFQNHERMRNRVLASSLTESEVAELAEIGWSALQQNEVILHLRGEIKSNAEVARMLGQIALYMALPIVNSPEKGIDGLVVFCVFIGSIASLYFGAVVRGMWTENTLAKDLRRNFSQARPYLKSRIITDDYLPVMEAAVTISGYQELEEKPVTAFLTAPLEIEKS